MKTRVTYSAIFLRISFVLLMIFSASTKLASQTWYNASWLYRIPVSVSNPGQSTLTNFQVKIELDLSNFDFAKAKDDGSDIRFTSGNGSELISYWIENWVQSASATIWVKVPSIPTYGTTIFMYFGNLGATSSSSGTGTFDFFDDFESSWSVTPRPNVWQDLEPIPTPSADNTISVYNNKLYSFGGYGINHVTLNTSYSFDPVTDEWTYLALMPTSRWGMVSVEFDEKIYVFGGDVDAVGSGTNMNEVYDPVTDSWTSRALGNPLPIQNYGAQGALHPDVIYFPEGNDGYKYWMVYTPYPPRSIENPSILRSHDGIRWTDKGITNPIIPRGDPGAWNDLENPDPDFIYVSELNKWFMVWDGGNLETDSRNIALAYSDDGKIWKQYDGDEVNGNANPIILSGNDIYGQSWEKEGTGIGGDSKTATPTLFYQDGIFYLFYAEEASGTNRGRIGLATFNWDNSANSIVSLTRNIGNPIITLPADAVFKSGGGHIDISKNPNTNTYYLYVVRELLGSTNFELSLLVSSSLTSGWVDQGKVVERGMTGQWDVTHIYRSCPIVNSTGEIVVTNNSIRMFYSAFGSITGNTGIGIADINQTNGEVVKLTGTGPRPMPGELSHQGLMAVRYGNKIRLFYKTYHYEYDPLADEYTRKADVPRSRTWGTCALIGNKIYLIGGYNYDPDESGGSNDTQILDLLTDTWSEGADIPRARYGSTRENPVIDGKIYVTHGWNDYWFYTATYVYDPVTNTWEQKGSANHPRDGVACGVINNKLYVVGGRNVPINTYGLIYNEVYDPGIDSWTPQSPPSQWNTSGANFVYTDASAKYQGSKGLVVRDPMDGSPAGLYIAEISQNFGSVYALDFDWNVTTLGGISEEPTTYPEATVNLAQDWPSYGSLYLYQNLVPALRWLSEPNYSWTDLQSSTWDTWHKVTVVRNGENSRVVFDGNLYSPLNMVTTGAGIARFGSIRSTQYLDNVRVRKWAGSDPLTIIGIEQNGTLNHWLGTINSNWNNADNWSSGTVPAISENVIIFNAPYYPVVPNSVTVTCNNLTIEPSARLTLDNGGTLTVNGVLTINSVGSINSGSLIVNGTLITTPGTMIYNRYMPSGSNWHYVSSPLGLDNPPSGSFYGWNEIAGDWTPATIPIPLSGVGYTLNTNGNAVAFTGSIVTSDIALNATSPYRYNDVISGNEPNYNSRAFVQSADGSHSGLVTRSLTNYGGGGWNLLGNPSTSAISVASFISANYNIEPTLSQFDPNYVALYLYNGNSYYYVSNFTGWTDGDELDQDYIQTGQGFFVLAMNDKSTFTFTKSMQSHSTGAILLKSNLPGDRWPGLRLKVKSGKNENQATVVFNNGMSLGLDPGYDIGMRNSNPGAEIYTALIEDNGINFARQALPLDNFGKNVIPVGVDFGNGGEVTFSAEIEPLRNFTFILEDRLTGSFTNLKLDSYTVTLPAKTFGTGRFFIHLSSDRSPRLAPEYPDLEDLRIWSSRSRHINIQGNVSSNAVCEVFDIWGHKILVTHLVGSDFNTFEVPTEAKGVYLIKVTDGPKIIIRKVVLL